MTAGVVDVLSYADARQWVGAGKTRRPHLLLGNGFSIAFDPARFTYSALRQTAQDQGLIGPIAEGLFARLATVDFEAVLHALTSATDALSLIDRKKYAAEVGRLNTEIAQLKEALAQVLAGLHPERPYEIDEAAYRRVRAFIDDYNKIYTANYDLLLYWSLMQSFPGLSGRLSDDGFRDPGYNVDYVVWDYLDPHNQRVFYLHGALHLFRGDDGLRKLTWIRTEEPLIDQIRAQLASNFFPLYVAEGTSSEKLTRIHTSDYLARAHRSLAAIGGGLLAYGLSFSANDAHIEQAIVRSKVDRLAVSIYGDPSSPDNTTLRTSVTALQRASTRPGRILEVQYFDAATLPLWN